MTDWRYLSSSLYIYLDGPPSIDLPCKFFFIHKYSSLSLSLLSTSSLSRPTCSSSYFGPISPSQLHPSLPFAILLSQPALPPPSLPFSPTLLLPTSLAIHRIWLFLFPSFNPGSDGAQFRAAFSPLFLWLFSLLTVDCCISLVSPPVLDQIARLLSDPWNKSTTKRIIHNNHHYITTTRALLALSDLSNYPRAPLSLAHSLPPAKHSCPTSSALGACIVS